MIFDLDSTHSDTFGNQENSDYNAHYQMNGYHPLNATFKKKKTNFKESVCLKILISRKKISSLGI